MNQILHTENRMLLQSKLTKFILVSIGIFFTTLLLQGGASALSGSDFKPGRIIDDAIFYDANSMNSTQIQQFLDAKVPNCDTNGSQPYAGTTRAEYGASRGYPAPYTCLKDYRQDISVKNPEESMCNGMSAASNVRASEIIQRVAQSCGISPKVLLILLQKEQSLVTDDWPWSIQYRSATGYGCPDSGPNYSANCDSSYFGFFNQVYNAARIYKYYAKYPNSFNHIAGRNNYVLYNPNPSCGGTTVFIENQATAGLYNYTPYQPNSSSLSNLYGSGDSCGAYGNRNFWRMFSDWFGSTTLRPSYTWSIASQELYTDEAMTQSISNHSIVTPNQTVYARLRLKNTGNQTWYRYNFNLATNKPKNKLSSVNNDSWLSQNRPGRLTETTVAPGAIGTITFSMTAPREQGLYDEHFLPVAEYVAWLNDWGMFYRLDVRGGSNYLHIQDMNTELYLDEARSQKIYNNRVVKGQTVYARTTFKNAGNAHFSAANTRLATSNPRDRISPYKDISWVSDNRISNIESSTSPGSTAVTNWKMNTPTSVGSYSESFSIVSDGVGWFDYVKNDVTLNVRESESIILARSQVLNNGESLYSKNGLYQLILQSDGNLVVYRSATPVWSTRTNASKPDRLVMQDDGNLVLYRGFSAAWDSL